MNTHSAASLVAGDDWEIKGTLLDEDDNPFDLTNAQILWTLVDDAFNKAIDTDVVNISVTDALAGECIIQVPATITSPLKAGYYSDVLRIVTGGITSTLWTGPFYIMADAFASGAAQMSMPKVGLGGTVTIPFRPRKPAA